MKSGELVEHPASQTSKGTDKDRELISSLAGNEAGRDRDVAQHTRRVVLASLGVLQGQKEGLKRSRALALAAILVTLLALGPFVWRVTDELIGGENLGDLATQTSLWVLILCPAILAAALFAGWRRK